MLIADNGSTDGSQDIAERLGARVVHVPRTRLRRALHRRHRGRARPATSSWATPTTATTSPRSTPFVEKLREGYDLVMGNRFQGGIAPGAMPLLHRYLGNPVLIGIGRLFFGSPVRRLPLRPARLPPRCRSRRSTCAPTGMEFASEMVVKATLDGLRITEVPTTLSPDGRIAAAAPAHLVATAGGTCASCCSTARAGCSSIPASR